VGNCLVLGNGGEAFELFAGFGGSGATLEAKKLPTLLHSLGMAISDEDGRRRIELGGSATFDLT